MHRICELCFIGRCQWLILSDNELDIYKVIGKMEKISRRQFLNYSLLSAAGMLMPTEPWSLAELPQNPSILTAPPAPLGRLTTWRQTIRAEPSPRAEWVGYRRYNDVISLYEQVEGVAPWPSNPIWYQTDEGYIHSGYVQPVENRPQGSVIQDVPETGFWAEVCVPIAEARWRPSSTYVSRRLYYETVYRVVDAVQDEVGAWWYQIHEGMTWAPGLYVPASTLRPISPDELAPISPGRADKRVQIDLSTHRLSCIEGEHEVYSAPFASGLPGTRTPKGEFHVIIKRHTRRMTGGEGDDYYDLPGVPFPVYFTWSGVAIHGTYWHNDYGRPKSHGCVNVPSKDAKWIFRWTSPILPYTTYSEQYTNGEGTRVVVI